MDSFAATVDRINAKKTMSWSNLGQGIVPHQSMMILTGRDTSLMMYSEVTLGDIEIENL